MASQGLAECESLQVLPLPCHIGDASKMIFLLVLHDSNSYFKDLGSEATGEVKLFILSFPAEGLLQRSNQRDTSSSVNPPSF